jgi:hypothetical protein
MDFVRSYFFTNATLTSCLNTFFIKIRFFLLMKKWATGQSCIHKKVTYYKVHNLVGGGD